MSTTNPAITENIQCLIIKAYAPVIDLKVGVSLHHGVSLRFVSLPALLATFQANNNIRSASASTALVQVSYRYHNACTVNCRLHGCGERNGAQRRKKVSFGRTMMQALKLLWLVKRHISGQNDIKQCKNQAHSLNGYQVTLV